MRLQSLKKGICICCETNSCIKAGGLLCRHCKRFITNKLKIDSVRLHNMLNNTYYSGNREYTCDLCNKAAIISYYHLKLHKRYHLCEEHLNRWLKIGAELTTLIHLIDKED